MYYTVYKITNTINGKIYIGCHKTTSLRDNYMGSGVAIKNAIKAYGKENFVKEILGVFDNKDDMFLLEKELVNSEFIKTDQTYNMKEGGSGGWDHVQTPKIRMKRSERLENYYKINGVSDATKKKISDKLKEHYIDKDNKQRQRDSAKKAMNRPDVKEKHRREIERRNKDPNYAKNISAKLKGKVFVHHPDHAKSKRVYKKDIPDLLEQGWVRGRKPRS